MFTSFLSLVLHLITKFEIVPNKIVGVVNCPVNPASLIVRIISLVCIRAGLPVGHGGHERAQLAEVEALPQTARRRAAAPRRCRAADIARD